MNLLKKLVIKCLYFIYEIGEPKEVDYGESYRVTVGIVDSQYYRKCSHYKQTEKDIEQD